ncbi:MAG: carboxyl transferase [Ruminococcaceae bacterium]|nr:carboxyl transferase [Oscillospiraceae bacterium]
MCFFARIERIETVLFVLIGGESMGNCCEDFSAVCYEKADQRIAALFDEGSFRGISSQAGCCCGPAGVVTGYGTVDGTTVFCYVQDRTVSEGAMDRTAAEKIKKIYSFAEKTGQPVVSVFDSNGGSLKKQQKTLSAYGELILASSRLSGVVPQIAVVCGPCGGSAALLAAAADILIITRDGELFAGQDEDGSADAAAKKGLADFVVESEEEGMALARELIGYLPVNNLSASPVFDAVEGAGETPLTTLCDGGDLLEFKAAFASDVKTGLCRIGGTVCGMVSAEGCLDEDGCAKAARFVRFCDAFSIPVVTLADVCCMTDTASAAKLASAYAEATTPKLACVTGKAIGAAFSVLAGKGAGADLSLAFEDALISALPEVTAVEILYNDRIAAGESREVLTAEYRKEASGLAAARAGSVDEAIRPETLRSTVISALDMLSGKRESRLPKKHSNQPM